MSLNVLFIAPGFPAEMPHFVHGLAQVGANVIGIGDGAQEMLPPIARQSLSAYIRVTQMWDAEACAAQIREEMKGHRIDRIECLWEPGVMLAAELRERLEVPGMTVEQCLPFRDKGVMKQKLIDAGLRVPKASACTDEAEIRAAAEEIGYPLIIKPIAGAGSKDTHRVDDDAQLDTIIKMVRHVAELSVEEYIDGEEFTFDTIFSRGKMNFFNVSWYRPRPLIQRTVEWISPQTVSLRNPHVGPLEGGVALGHAVHEALGFEEGFTHMEWFLNSKGEAVFGEIACRAPGARSVDVMNYSTNVDTFVGWANAVCFGELGQTIRRTHNAAVIFKRAHGQGRISRIDGLERIMNSFGRHVLEVELLPVGARRRNWIQTLVSDGYIILRHADLQTCCDLADKVGTDLQLYAS